MKITKTSPNSALGAFFYSTNDAFSLRVDIDNYGNIRYVEVS